MSKGSIKFIVGGIAIAGATGILALNFKSDLNTSRKNNEQQNPTIEDTYNKSSWAEKEDLMEEMRGREVEVLEIQGNFYPVEQFHIAEPDRCKEQHWHANVAFSLNRESIMDPDPTGCGFGTISKLKSRTITTNLVDYDNFRKEIY